MRTSEDACIVTSQPVFCQVPVGKPLKSGEEPRFKLAAMVSMATATLVLLEPAPAEPPAVNAGCFLWSCQSGIDRPRAYAV